VTGKDLKEYSFRVPESGTKSFFLKFPSKLLGEATQKARSEASRQNISGIDF
jgi:hypothetical protein